MRLQQIQFFALAAWGSMLPVTTAGAANEPFPQPRQGWTMQLVAEAPTIRHPSVVCAAPDGRVFVAEDPMDISSPHAHLQEGKVLCLHLDGRVTVFAEKLYAVFGMQYLEGKLYVLHNPKFSVFRDDNGIGRDRFELIEQTNPEPWALDWNDHVPANFRLAMDGYFYVAVGDKGLFGAVDRSGRRVDLHGGGVIRIRPDGTGLEVYCSGVRNILDVAINDEDELFTYDNTDEHQWMGRLTHMVDGGFYGYPFDFIPRRSYTLWMFADYGPGAATGTLAWNDDALLSDWRGNLILADFGQRNLRRVRVAREGGSFRAVADELLFPNPPADFRPVGISETADGSGFYICDWQHVDNKERVTVGRLWKLTASFATNTVPKPSWYLPVAMGKSLAGALDELMAGLSHPQKAVRLAAQRALSRRGADAVPALIGLLNNSAAPASARWHALWALDGIDAGATARQAILNLTALPTSQRTPPELVRQAIRQLGERQVREAVPLLVRQLTNADASVRFHAATALRRIGDSAAVPPLLQALGERDLFARFPVFTTLNQLGRAHPELWPRLVRGLDHSEPVVREAAGFALRETFDLALVNALAEAAADTSRPVSARTSALRLLTAVHRQPPPWKGEWWAYHPAKTQPPARTLDWAGTPVILSTLRDRLGDSEPALRMAAAAGLREARHRESATDMRNHFRQESDLRVRVELLKTLGDFGDLPSAPIVADLLRSPAIDVELLPEALSTAGKLGALEATPVLSTPLTNLLARTDLSVTSRSAALDALGQFKLASAVPLFVRSAQSSDARERQTAVAALVRLGGLPAVAALRELARADLLTTRREAVTALGRLKQREGVPDLLAAWGHDETRDVALESLTELPDLRALDAYLAGLGGANVAMRDKCRRALIGIAAEALPVLQARRENLTALALSELRRVYEKDPAALASPLFADAARPTDTSEYERFALNHPGSPQRGQTHFFNLETVACAKCHAVAGNGGTVGPDLTTIGAQFGRGALIESILFPSKAVREGYQQYTVELTDGESLTGAIRADSADILTLVDVEGRPKDIPKAQIKERRGSAQSLMPEGLHAALTLEEFADLIAYVESLRVDPRRTESKR